MKKLPLGLTSFKEIIEGDYIYVDKTKDIYKLITELKFQFLSRPRRFGKSLLISTLVQIFSGNKELFKNLWIYNSDYDWKKYPIIKIDFSAIGNFDSAVFSKGVCDVLDAIARSYAIDISSYDTPESKLRTLISDLYEKEETKVVVLVDEYDVPLNRNLNNIKLALQNQDILRDLFSVLKAKDSHIHKLFVTGVTKLSNTSMFSGPNNIKDISLLNKFDSILGYTQEELESYFSSHIKEESAKYIEKKPTLLELIKIWYNGFQFSEEGKKVYNPFSILNFFNDAQDKSVLRADSFKNYWIASGTPKFLIDLASKKANHKKLLKIIYDLTDKNNIVLSEEKLDSLNLKSLPIDSLMFQAGYLTIESYQNHAYKLRYPNQEIANATNKYLIAALIDSDEDDVREYAFEMRQALENNDLEEFFEQIESLFLAVPYDYQKDFNKENIYNSVLLMITKMIGFEPIPELHTGKGHADLFFKTSNFTFIFEYKYKKSAGEALEQIKDREYYKRFLKDAQVIILVGVNFALDNNNKFRAIEWISEEIRP